MNNHSLISASRNTHAKIAFLAVAVSVVFVAVVSATGVTRESTRITGPIVKATTSTTIANTGASQVR